MKSVDIQLIRNATLKLNYNGKTILVDPMFSPVNSFMSFVVPNKNLNPIVGLPMPIEDITNGVDLVMVSHLHPDHFDGAAIEALDKALPFLVQPTDVNPIKASGFSQVTALEESITKDGIEYIRTKGQHGPDALLEQLGFVSGFVLKAKNYPTVYIIGDCIWTKEIEQTIKQYNPDIIITNSGGAVFMGEHQILMDAFETIEVAKAAPQAKLIATHMESLDHCKTTRPLMHAKAKEAGVEVLVPKDGEVIVL